MSASTLELKQYILSRFQALKLERRQSYLTWLLERERDNPTMSFDDLLALEKELEEIHVKANLLIMESRAEGYETTDFWREVVKLNQAYYARLKRLKARVYNMILNCSSLWFTTLTFTDDTLASTSYDTRRDYVKRFCRAQSDHYIANVDYGKDNGREHFHALISSDGICNSDWTDYGFIYLELCYLDVSDIQAVSKYTAKLSNHAVKETCKQSKIIYSRSKRNDKKTFEVVGLSTIKAKDSDRSYDVLHLVGEPFYSNHTGKLVCTSFVGVGEYLIGDIVEVINHKGDYIII